MDAKLFATDRIDDDKLWFFFMLDKKLCEMTFLHV